jgi:hypothetical protein
MSNILIVNLEEGFPARDEALKKLENALVRARRDGVRVIKVIHGYGSTGVGGILRPVVRNYLRRAKERGEVRLFVNGESWSSFDSRSRELLGEAAQLLLDRDLWADLLRISRCANEQPYFGVCNASAKCRISRRHSWRFLLPCRSVSPHRAVAFCSAHETSEPCAPITKGGSVGLVLGSSGAYIFCCTKGLN